MPGDFLDAVFDQIAFFIEGRMRPKHWAGEIDKIEL